MAVVIDATWQKARRLCKRLPDALPRAALRTAPLSRCATRAQSVEGSVSSVDAAVALCAELGSGGGGEGSPRPIYGKAAAAACTAYAGVLGRALDVLNEAYARRSPYAKGDVAALTEGKCRKRVGQRRRTRRTILMVSGPAPRSAWMSAALRLNLESLGS